MSEAQNRVDAREFAEWLAWERIEHEEPVGLLGRLEHIVGELCALTGNIALGGKGKQFAPDDFKIRLIAEDAAEQLPPEIADSLLDAKINQAMIQLQKR